MQQSVAFLNDIEFLFFLLSGFIHDEGKFTGC
ncbi:hypothetical protein N568_0111905 [Lactococcus garvieae TRF1]|uniref:Uncharacterized protein n=1 Tax=Lactococcus garvieae TRF1 TaxID=1380772 RepID=V8ANG5_9LACT|nr:hypothetical protein N568_0111905 [Lactococcus garvieae TRF1]